MRWLIVCLDWIEEDVQSRGALCFGPIAAVLIHRLFVLRCSHRCRPGTSRYRGGLFDWQCGVVSILSAPSPRCHEVPGRQRCEHRSTNERWINTTPYCPEQWAPRDRTSSSIQAYNHSIVVSLVSLGYSNVSA